MSIRRGSRIALSIVEIHQENVKQTTLSLSELMKRIKSRNPLVDNNDIREGFKFAEVIHLIELQIEGDETVVIFYPPEDTVDVE